MAVYAVSFSPGGTTRACVLNVASGFEDSEIIDIDMTLEANRQKTYHLTSSDILILGMPTMTKLFGLPEEIMDRLTGTRTPFIPIVTCGNGYYGKGLIAMKSSMEKRGFVTVGAGGFVGQYSFNKDIAKGRPDRQDYKDQYAMGLALDKKIKAGQLTFDHKLRIDWPKEGMFSSLKCGLISALPGSGGSLPKSMRQLAVSDACVSCKKCLKACPMNAISYKGKIEIDFDKCIGCYACGNVCPVSAISHTNKTMIKSVANVVAFRDHRKPLDIFV